MEAYLNDRKHVVKGQQTQCCIHGVEWNKKAKDELVFVWVTAPLTLSILESSVLRHRAGLVDLYTSNILPRYEESTGKENSFGMRLTSSCSRPCSR